MLPRLKRFASVKCNRFLGIAETLSVIHITASSGKAAVKRGKLNIEIMTGVNAMTTITFDTLELVDKLKSSGIPQAQAEAVVRVIAEAQDGLITKHDLTEVKNEIKAEMNVRFERIDGELKLNRWMLGVLLAGVISLVLKAFF
ncbi:MAG: hypothetical protein Q7U66_06445 [Methylobacter sp.]|nr:hypothetical protein [Methylobacter sp.]